MLTVVYGRILCGFQTDLYLTDRGYEIPVWENMTPVSLLVTKPHLVLEYDRSSGTSKIYIPESQMMRYSSHICGLGAASTAENFLDSEYSTGQAEICEPVRFEVFGFA